MNDLDREFSARIEAKIAQVRMLATLKKGNYIHNSLDIG